MPLFVHNKQQMSIRHTNNKSAEFSSQNLVEVKLINITNKKNLEDLNWFQNQIDSQQKIKL